jgi:ABC-type nitrate/sulfonate/bicarbonate transport system permease component
MSFRCRVIRGLLGLAWRWWGPAALIAVWLWWIWVGRVPRVVAPRPTDVALEFLHPAWLLDALLSTLWLTLVGAVLGLLGGTLLAVACWWFSSARPMIMTPAILTQLIPVVVFIPILGRLVGFGTPSVLAIAVLSGFFPSLVFVDSGLSSVPRARADLVSLLGASRFRYLRHVALPSSVPRLAVAVRLTAASAFLGTVTADYLVGSNGLGRLMAETQFFLRTSRSWAIATLVIALSVGAYSAAGRLERWAYSRFEIGEI